MTGAVELASRLSGWRPPRDTLGIVALGQAGFAIRGPETLVLIDPFLSLRPDRVADPVVDPREMREVNVVLATHEHVDHLDLPVWRHLAVASPRASFIVPEPLVGLVTAAGIAADRVIGARPGVAIATDGSLATAVPACHAVRIEDGYSTGGADGMGTPRFVGYVIEMEGVTVYHAGDTVHHESLVTTVAALAPDIALLPINGRDAEREARGVVGNLTPDEAARMARELGVALAVPMHFDLIQGNLGRPDVFVRAMRWRHPGASVWVPGRAAGMIWPARGRSWRSIGVPA